MIRVLQEQKEHKGHLDPRGLPDLADLRFVLFILKKKWLLLFIVVKTLVSKYNLLIP